MRLQVIFFLIVVRAIHIKLQRIWYMNLKLFLSSLLLLKIAYALVSDYLEYKNRTLTKNLHVVIPKGCYATNNRFLNLKCRHIYMNLFPDNHYVENINIQSV